MKKTTLSLLFLLTTSVLFAQDTLLWQGKAKSYVNIVLKQKKRLRSAICEVRLTDSSIQIEPIEKIFDQMPTTIQSEIKFGEIKKIRKTIYLPYYTIHLNNGKKIPLTHFSQENKRGFTGVLNQKTKEGQTNLKIIKPPLWEYLVVTPWLIVFPAIEFFEPAVK